MALGEIDCVLEADIYRPDFDFTGVERLKHRPDEKLLLRALVQIFLDHSLCIAEDTPDGRHLVFPSRACLIHEGCEYSFYPCPNTDEWCDVMLGRTPVRAKRLVRSDGAISQQTTSPHHAKMNHARENEPHSK